MLARNKKNDDDDNVNNIVVQGRSEVESEEKDQTEISKKNALASEILDHGVENEKNKEKLVNKKTIITEEDDNDLIHSDNVLDKNNEELEEKGLRIERTKDILEFGHWEESKRDGLECEELILSRQTQK